MVDDFDFKGLDVPQLRQTTLANTPAAESERERAKAGKKAEKKAMKKAAGDSLAVPSESSDAQARKKAEKKAMKKAAKAAKAATKAEKQAAQNAAKKVKQPKNHDAQAVEQSAADAKVKQSKKGKQRGGARKLFGGTPMLFEPMDLRGVTVRNRIWLPPMDTYSAFGQDGRPTEFHYQHYVSRAMGGFGMIIAEATAVAPEGRISPCDVGLWEDGQIDAWRWIVDGIKAAGAVPAVQLNHAGRKGSTGCFATGYEGQSVPREHGGWQTVAPSPIAFGGLEMPHELSVDEIHGIVQAFADAAGRAITAGFQAIEIHAAHGYLISQFLDPLSNERTDEYGGNLDGRARLLMEIVDAIRARIPEDTPLLVRISATDWAAGGWDVEQTIAIASVLKHHGVDLADVSTGGIIAGVSIPVGPGYQVPFAKQVRAQAGVPVTAVGLITKPKQAEKILERGEADAIEIGRAALRDPYWPLRAAAKLGVAKDETPYPQQYVRGAFPKA